MELRAYLEILRRRWWILALIPLVAGVTAFGVSKQMTPIYQATAKVLVNQTQVPGVVQYNDVLASERLTSTYAELVTRGAVLNAAITKLGLPISPETLAGKTTVTPLRNTQILKISVEDPDPILAARMANVLAQAFLDDNQNQITRPGSVSISDEAKVPGSPAKPNIRLNTALGVMLGIMLAGLVVVVVEYLDDTVKSPDDVEALVGTSTLGLVGLFKGRDKLAGLAASHSSDSAEAYRQVRTSVHFTRLTNDVKSILVTSSNPGEGKSTTAANLAYVLAQAGDQVVLVDTDLRRPTLHSVFGVPNSFGLTGFLLSEMDSPEPALVNTGITNLRVLPSGPLPPNPSELLTSTRMKTLMDALAEMADYVIFDSPPILAVTDASILAAKTDGVILVMEMARTRSQTLRRTRQALDQAGARVLGAVLNKARSNRRGYYYYGYRPAAQPSSMEDVSAT